MAFTRCVLSVSLEDEERDKAEPTEDVGQDSGPRDCSVPRTASPTKPVTGVNDAGDGLVSGSSLGASSSL